MENLACRLEEARKNRGLTKMQAAELLQVSVECLASWEKGEKIPETLEIPKITALYGITADWLLSGTLPSAGILEVTSNLSDRLFNESRMTTYIGAYCNAKALYQTRGAMAFAWKKHDGQFRKKGHGDEKVPYIYHPLLLTCHALALGLDEDDLLSACLLHDVCEDCGVKPEELPVSEAAREAVRLLTKPEDFRKTEEEETAYYDGIAGNRIATLVKLLDRCNNVSSMATSFSNERMADYIRETQKYIHPLLQKARDLYPRYSNQLFLIRYHMNSVLEALRHHMRSML